MQLPQRLALRERLAHQLHYEGGLAALQRLLAVRYPQRGALSGVGGDAAPPHQALPAGCTLSLPEDSVVRGW